MIQPANPWRRTADEMPPEGVVVEVRLGDRGQRIATICVTKALFGRNGWTSLTGNPYLYSPKYWRPILQGEPDGN